MSGLEKKVILLVQIDHLHFVRTEIQRYACLPSKLSPKLWRWHRIQAFDEAPRCCFIVGVCWWTCQTENQAFKPTMSHKPHMRLTSHMGTNTSLKSHGSQMNPRRYPTRYPTKTRSEGSHEVRGIRQTGSEGFHKHTDCNRQRSMIGWNLRSSHNLNIISEPNVLIWLR